jgi:hypothetical protein
MTFLGSVHRKLGNSRETSFQTINVQSMTNGTFITTIYDTRFERGDAVESFTWRKHGTGLVLLRYNIQSNTLVND